MTLVVTAKEMQRIEKLAFEAGESGRDYMETAGREIAAVLEKELITPSAEFHIHLLVGKGNNGGDAFVAGYHLLKKGFDVTAHHLAPLDECSPLCEEMGARFKKNGGKLDQISHTPQFNEKGIIVDGLTGTGFEGAAKGALAETIEAANQAHLPCYAIDIPSGLNGNTGEVETLAIKADATLYLALPKIGFFQGQGWDHVGELIPIDFGMPEKFLHKAKSVARIESKQSYVGKLPPIKRTRHKYQAGYLLAVAGSPGMSGAALLSSYSALKTGTGIVRLFYPKEMEGELANAPYELIKESWDLSDDARITEEAKRAKALIVGPGIGRSDKTHKALRTLLAKTTLPTVIDADALYFLSIDPEMNLPDKTVLTPQTQEMERILGKPPTLAHCQEYVKEKGVTLVLKGAPTFLFHPHTQPLIIPYGDPGMATAGTGDVLTGVIGSMLAQGLSPNEGASLGVLLHALAGEIAAERESSFGMTATDLLHSLPEAILALIK